MRMIFAPCLVLCLLLPLSACNNSKLEKELSEARQKSAELESEVERLGSELTRSQNEFRLALEARATKDADRCKRETDALTSKVSELSTRLRDCRDTGKAAAKPKTETKGKPDAKSKADAKGKTDAKARTTAKTPAKAPAKTPARTDAQKTKTSASR